VSAMRTNLRCHRLRSALLNCLVDCWRDDKGCSLLSFVFAWFRELPSAGRTLSPVHADEALQNADSSKTGFGARPSPQRRGPVAGDPKLRMTACLVEVRAFPRLRIETWGTPVSGANVVPIDLGHPPTSQPGMRNWPHRRQTKVGGMDGARAR
jgi:hypothetical protein